MARWPVSLLLGVALMGSAAQLTAQAPTPSRRAAPANAYRYRLLGVYDDQSGEPIEGVEVADAVNRNSMSTTRTGTVSLLFLPDGGGLVRLRKVGYETQTMFVSISPADTTPITITLKRVTQLPTVVVKDSAPTSVPAFMRGFEERKAEGFGHFVVDSVFRRHDTQLLSDLLLAQIPGVLLAPVPRVPGKMALSSGRKQCAGAVLLGNVRGPKPVCTPCYVSVYIDGVRVFDPEMADFTAVPDMTRMSAHDYGAAEFYQGAAIPAAYLTAANSDCGVLLLWTRAK